MYIETLWFSARYMTEAHNYLSRAGAHPSRTRSNLVAAEATNAAEIVTAFAKFIEQGAGALFVGTGAFPNSHREAIVSLAASHAIPAMYSLREFAFPGCRGNSLT